MEFTFDAELWEYPGKAAWYFFSMPTDIADEIAETSPSGGRGFGSVPVQVRIGGTSWRTSLFPDRRRATYLLPIKKSVRVAENLAIGRVATATVTLLAGEKSAGR
ncbi:MAG: DUF1905 domain-containing protein [Angustibacter sp.]